MGMFITRSRLYSNEFLGLCGGWNAVTTTIDTEDSSVLWSCLLGFLVGITGALALSNRGQRLSKFG